MKGALPVSFSYRAGEQTHNVYTVDEIKRYDQKFLHGVRNGTKSIQKCLPEHSYFLAIMSKRSNCYVPSTNLQRAKLLLKSKWVRENVLQNVANNEDPINDDEPTDVEATDNVTTANQTKVSTSTAVQDSPAATAPSYKLAPPLLELNDDEKFRNAEGIPVDIETRGVRSPRRIFFRVVDISRAFGITNLKNSLCHPTSCYERNRDFVTFTHVGKNVVRTSMFLTYIGLLRVLFVSRNKNTDIFHDWASTRLFSMGMIVPSSLDHLSSRKGVIYAITSPYYDAVKLGRWSKSIESLRTRYQLLFPTGMILDYVDVDDAVAAERDMLRHFKPYCIGGEVHLKSELVQYVNWFKLIKQI